MKFLFDENISVKHAVELRANSYDAVSVLEVGLSGRSDGEIWKYCLKEKRIIVTLDSDFSNILKYQIRESSGVIRIKIKNIKEFEIREALSKCLSLIRNIRIENKLVVYEKNKIRIRG